MVNPDRVRKLVSAIQSGDAKLVRLMLKGGVPANHFVANGMGNDGATLANMAARSGQAEIFHLLIAEGADINAREVCSWSVGKSMLECACSARVASMEIVRTILENGKLQAADLNRALISAAYENRELVGVLLKAGADPNYADQHFDTPLVIALTCGQEHIAIDLLEAGADASIRVKNNHFAEFWKKSLVEVAKKQGMQQFLDRVAVSQPQALAASKQAKVAKPKTIKECWAVIERWLAEKLPKVKLPGPAAMAAESSEFEALHLPVAEQLRESLAVHDGTGEFALVAVSSDSSYHILSYADAATAKKMMQEVWESESQLAKSPWWSATWWPIADNGGGDFLVLECGEGKRHGQILKFSHETRRTSVFARSFLAVLQGVAVDLVAGAVSPAENGSGVV